jgi:uncharacterized membrane protein YdjX (TVP38/TMEM64 family)
MTDFEPALDTRSRQRRRRKALWNILTDSIRDASKTLRTRRWWRDHWIALLPYSALALMLLTVGIGYLTSESIRAEVQELIAALTSGDQDRLRDYLHEFGAWGPIVSMLLMVLQVLVAPVPASVVQLANGVVYGQFWGTILNIAGQMLGAMLAFSIARGLGKGAVERLAGQVNGGGFETWLHRWGGYALFVIRAIPGMPSDFMSYVAGLTNMKTRTYVLATIAGYIPQSFFYAWLGDAAMTWFWWIIAGGFGVSALIGAAAWLIQRRSATERAGAKQDCPATTA